MALLQLDADDKDTLKKVAVTAMSGKGSDYAKEHLADLVVEAALRIEEDGKSEIDNINIQRVSGDSVEDSFLAEGIVIDKTPLSKNMPESVEDAKIAIMKYPIELKDINTDAKIDITSPDQFEAFLDQEEQMIKDLVNRIIDSGVNVLFCQKGIDDMAEHYLKKAGIMAYKS